VIPAPNSELRTLNSELAVVDSAGGVRILTGIGFQREWGWRGGRTSPGG
jgi:hypothetical protein